MVYSMSQNIANSGAPQNSDQNKLFPISKGSYHQQSYLSLLDSKHTNKANKRRSSPRRSPHVSVSNSYTSFSQLRLKKLAESHNWDQLEDFELEELRDGFFDAVFTKPEKKYLNIDDISHLEANNHFFRSCTIKFATWKPFYEDLRNKLSENWVTIIKFFIPFFISFVLCVIKPVGDWIGHDYRYFLPIGVILHHPVRNIGVQLEMTVFSIIGITFALGWSSLAWYISTATGPTAKHQGGILFQSLAMALTFSIWFKTYYQRFLYFSLSFGIIIIFTHTVSLVFSKNDLQWIIFRDITLSYLFGILLSLFTCILVFPHSGNKALLNDFRHTLVSTKRFLVGLIDRDIVDDCDKLFELKQVMTESLTIQLSQSYRDFFNQISVAKFNRQKLEEFRNSLTTFYGPLRVIPLKNKLLDKDMLTEIYITLNKNEDGSAINGDYSKVPLTEFNSESETPRNYSGGTTPKQGISSAVDISPYENFYISVLQKQFGKSVIGLIVEMIVALELLDESIMVFTKYNSKNPNVTEITKKIEDTKLKLKKRINKLDRAYKDFTKLNIFSNDLLSNSECVIIFVFLRYLRNSAKNLLEVLDACHNMGKDIHWRLQLPHYPLKKALHRLPKQCAIDEGSDSFLHYYDTKKDVEEIFERIYNSYTSKHAYIKKNDKTNSLRAIDHDDFNLHTTRNELRYKIWKFSNIMSGFEMKWSLKIVFCIIFLCLPTWLPESYKWYQEFQCWWAALIFFILVHRKPTGGFKRLLIRLVISIFCMFWGWAACQARHFGSPYVICTFAGLLAIPVAINLLIYQNPKTSFAGLISFTVISLESYSKGKNDLDTAKIWKNTWITSLSLIIGITTSVCVNWIFWSYKARTEVRLAVSSLLSYLSQSYQSITDRYLYRDLDDQPTEMTLSFGRIREVRLTQNIEAIRGLLKRAILEPNYVSNFDHTKYEKLIDSCQLLMEKLIECRISGSYFQIWEQDKNKDATRALLSSRRDAVASVIFVFYILSNCFRSKNKVPKYLPNTILSRKKLYDYINKLDEENETKRENLKYDSLQKRLFANKNELNNELGTKKEGNVDDYEKMHWTEVYGMVFASAFTDVSEAVENLIDCCKSILGEESY